MARKKHEAHGGAWKVAYADFVTAMMALFIVLWLSSQDQRIKEAIARSFKNPFSSITKDSTGIIPNKETQAMKASSGSFDSASAVELAMLRRLNEDLLKTIQKSPDIDQEDSVKLDLTPEGLRVSVFDRARKPIFEENTAQFTTYGGWVFSTLAWQIARYPTFNIELEGHTEKGHSPARVGYDNWDLTTDRANAGRRKLVENGVLGPQVRKISGYADTIPLPNFQPGDEVNRRVSVMLKVGEKKGHQ